MTKTVAKLFILILGGIFFGSCAPSVPEPLTDAELQTQVAATLGALFPSSTSTRFVMPPTWTPTPSPIPSETPVPPTVTPTPEPSPIVSLTPMPAHFTFYGGGSESTSVFLMRTGKYKVSWIYGGATGEQTQIRYIENVHDINVDSLKNWVNIWKPYYQNMIDEAVANRDAMRILKVQRELENIEQQYDQKLEDEIERYEAELARYLTRFVVQIGKNAGSLKLLVAEKGAVEGFTTFTAAEDGTYFFKVEASGSWQIKVDQ